MQAATGGRTVRPREESRPLAHAGVRGQVEAVPGLMARSLRSAASHAGGRDLVVGARGSLEFRPGARRDTARRAGGRAVPGRRPRHLALGRAGAGGGESGTPAPVLGRGRRPGRRPGPGNSPSGQHVGGRDPPLQQPGVVVEIESLLESAGQSLQSVEMCLPTGGVVAMPVVQERLLRLFGPSRCEFVERADTLIGEGAAWVAAEDVPLKLAKNIEFRHADQTWVPIIKGGRRLPKGSQSSDPVRLTLFCADPRNGTADIELARPKRPSRVQAADPRQCYELMRVDVDREAAPLRESIKVTLTVDPDLIVHVSGVAVATGREARTEIHELEFGIGLTPERHSTDLGEQGRSFDSGGRGEFGARVKGLVREFVAAQEGVHAEPWVSIVDRIYVKGRQESLESAIGRAYIDEYRRPPESVITLLQGLGVPCVKRDGAWIVANPDQSTTPHVLEAAPLGPAASVLVRANVTKRWDDLRVIPGDIVDEHHPGFTASIRVTARQRDELRWS